MDGSILIRLMIGCMGGGCDYRISPFLEYSIAYAVSSIVLIAVMQAFRAKHVA